MTGFNSDLETVDIKASGPESAGSDVGVIESRTSDLQPIIEAAGTEAICIPLPDGSKASTISHDDTANHITPQEVVGNYGLVPKGDVVYLDVDDPAAFPFSKDEFAWTQESVHGEGYHAAVESQADVNDSRKAWGNIQATIWYIVGPGSKIDHDEYCDDCGEAGIGAYQLSSVGSLDVVGEDFWSALEVDESDGSQTPSVQVEDAGIDFSIQNRVAIAKNAKNGDQFTALWEGRYRDCGYSDRSNAEMELVDRLAFWMQKNERAIRTAMSKACSEHPRAQGGETRKWVERPDGYRAITIQNAVQEVDNVYEGGETTEVLPWELKPEVSRITKDNVFKALLDLRIAQKKRSSPTPRLIERRRKWTRRSGSTRKPGA